MKSFTAKALALVLLAGCLAPAAAFAEDVPLNNWTVPPYRQMGTEGGMTTMADITFAHPFVGVTPCRLVDTRQAGFPAGYGTPALVAGIPRNFDLNSQPNCVAASSSVAAYSLNFTVTNTQGPGFLKVFPQGGAIPADISTINYVGGQTIANAAIVPAGTGGGITVIAGVSGTDVIIDINGYFASVSQETGTPFVWETSNIGTFGAALIENNDASANDTFGLVARVHSTGAQTAAVRGSALGLTGKTYGVWGQSMSTNTEAAGVKGVGGSGLLPISNCCGDLGVLGESRLGFGTVGLSNSTAGLFLRYSPAAAVLGFSWIATDLGSDYAFFASTGDYGGNGAKFFVEPHPTDAKKIIRYISLEGPESGTYFRGRAKFLRGMARIDVPEDFRIVTAEEGLSIQVTPIGQMATVAVLNIGLDEIVVRGSRDVEFFYTVNGVRKAYQDFKPIIDAEDGGEFLPMTADARMPEYNAETKRRLIQNGTYKADGTVNMETARRLGWDHIWREKEQRTPVPVQPE